VRDAVFNADVYAYLNRNAYSNGDGQRDLYAGRNADNALRSNGQRRIDSDQFAELRSSV
jgi:hypothetical protein